MQTYLVTSPLRYDGKNYAPGDRVEMERDGALALIAIGALTVATDARDGGATELPEDFPGRPALLEAGKATLESLAGMTAEDLQQLKGIGAATAAKILEALAG